MSETATPGVPRLKLDDEDVPRLIEVVSDLYIDVLRTFNHNTTSTPERVLELVAKRWMANNQGPFMLVLAHWSASAFTPPQIWEEPTTSYDEDDFTRPLFTKSWRLKRLDEIDLMIDDFGSGDGFYACFELRGAITEADYDALMVKFDCRDNQLARQSTAS